METGELKDRTPASVSRSLFRFRLRSLLILFFVLAIPFTVIARLVSEYREQKAVVNSLRYHEVSVNIRSNGFQSIWNKVFGSQWGTAQAVFLPRLARNKKPAMLSKKNALEISKNIGELPSLEKIYVFPDMGFRLHYDLDMSPSEVDELERIAFYDDGARFNDACIEEWKNLTNLKTLRMMHTHVTDKSGIHLRRLHRLHTLDMSFTRVSDSLMEDIQDLRLRTLLLHRSRITDVGLDHLTSIHTLRHLDVRDTLVTSKGVEDFRSKMPHVKVKWDGMEMARRKKCQEPISR